MGDACDRTSVLASSYLELFFRSNDKFVADAMNCDDIARVARGVFDLLAQLGDVHINCSRERETAVPPDRIEQLVAGNYFAAMFDEIFQNVELSRGDFNRRAGFHHFELFEIDTDRAETKFFGNFALTVCATEKGFDAGHQLHKAEWLCHIIVCADLQPYDLINLLATGGEHDDWSGVPRAAKLFADIESTQFRQHHVQ